MIRSAGVSKEVVVTSANKIGQLDEICKVLTGSGINIDGVAGYAANGEARIMVVTKDATRAVEFLHGAGFASVKEGEVIVIDLENKPGALKLVTDRLAAESIDINYTYGTVCAGGCPAKLVLSTSNDQKALVALKKKK